MTAAEIFDGRLVMAPMSRGTDLPFRRLIAEWGCQVCFGEMAYAHKLVRGEPSELALLRRHPAEKAFGAQLAGKHPGVMADAARIAADHGADFVDVNLGCPIDDATRRGFGAALLGRPGRVAKIVEAMAAAVDIPITVKLRLGWSEGKPTFLKIGRAAESAGAGAITLHARSRAQRYRRPADWSCITELAESVSIPVIGNGDVFGWQDARRRLEESRCAAVMVGRWGLSKPWLFREFAERRSIEPGPEQRLDVVRRYVELCRDLFRDDARGRRRTRRFLTFHQDFFRRFRRGSREAAVNSEDVRDWGEDPADDLERLLCRADPDGVEALCDWLVDDAPLHVPPPPPPDAGRAVKLKVYG